MLLLLFSKCFLQTKENVRFYMKNFIKKGINSPYKVKEPKKYTRKNCSNINLQQITNQISKKNKDLLFPKNIKLKTRYLKQQIILI